MAGLKLKYFLPRLVAAILVPVIWLIVVILPSGVAFAGPGDDPNAEPGIDDKYCLSCHETPGFRTTLPSGEELYIGVSSITHNTSTHGRLGYACVQCHTDIREYPHRPILASTRREYSLEMYDLCDRCHYDNYEATLDSTHQQALASGNLEAAVCTDCHGAHGIDAPTQPLSKVPEMCQRCHSEIYDRYEQSVHGAALLNEGDPFVPTCTDCHGVHGLSGPSYDEEFHLFSPEICGDCHADEALMERYGVSTHVFDTYISDFHGTTVVLFEKISPDQETNKPVCIDCHGVHDMRKVDDPESTVIKENLLATCQKCHPDATSNFPTSWLSHYEPSQENAPLVYFINLFYQIVIPVTIGGMLLYVATDVGRKIINKRERRDE